MAPTPAHPDAAPGQPRRRYTWLLALVVAAGIAASLSVSYALYRRAEDHWIARSESEAQRLSTLMLGWMDESYAPLSGLAALVENSPKIAPEEFLNAFDSMESRATAVLLGAAAMLERDAKGRWVPSISSGNFELLEKDAADGFVKLRPVIETALARRNQFVLGPPISWEDGKPISPVMLALSNVKIPTILVGKLEYATLERALRGTPTPKGFYLTLKGKFMEAPEIQTIVQAGPDQPPVEKLVTRAATGGADLEIVWGVTKQYRAHELVRHAFGRYVSEEVAESLLRAPEALDLGGEEREASILMSDLRGFTAMAARLSPHEVIEVLNLYLEAMVEVIGRHQGTIDEIVGDALLVIFGAPVACDDHAEKAVACGLAMQLAMTEVNRRLVATGGAELEMGIGVHTGRVIVGNIGSLRRTKYAAVGATVNLAGRIESFTVGGQLLISEDTREKIKAPLRIDEQYQVEPKGASRSLLLYEIGGIGAPFWLSLPSRALPLQPVASPLPVRFTVLEEKFAGRTVHEGRLTALSTLEAGMESHLRPAVLSNLQINVAVTPLGNPSGEIYGKVVESVDGAPCRIKIRFSSVTPELKTWVRALSV